jgi:hypothetical protein
MMNSSQELQNLSPLPAVPTLGAAFRAQLARAGRSLWHALEAYGRTRARQHMRELADRYETTRPDLAKSLRAASE